MITELKEYDVMERLNSGTTKTNDPIFEEKGYKVLRNFYDPTELICAVPNERGSIRYWGKKLDQYNINGEEQVPGSAARYWYPPYQKIHNAIRLKIEKEIGKKLYNTYYYDRFYFSGQELTKHADRPACEISVSLHIGTNLPKGNEKWPIWIKTPDIYADEKKKEVKETGSAESVVLLPGDALLYKGCERPHWREPLPFIKKPKKIKEEFYYHQIFFHYVLQDGIRAHYAFDATS
jgi:hypothetical protein